MTGRKLRLVVSSSAVFLLAAALCAQDFQARQIGGVGITIFRDENFRGENATFRQDVPDLRRYDFGDRITSLRVGPGEYWEACESANYRGRCQVFSGEERDLRRIGWSDRISSLRRVRGGGGGGYLPPPAIGKRGIVLYDDPFFSGRSITITDSSENLRFQNFHDRAESVRVLSGSWEICSEPRFRRCQTVDHDVPQLSSLGMNKKLSSVRFSGWGAGGAGGGGNYPPTYPERARLVLFESEGYRGRSITLDSAVGDLGGFAGRARSAQIISGTWLVCDRPGFSGKCRQITSSQPDLGRWNFTGGILSARPVDNY